ncbi:Crossover junction endonuclease mus81 [Rhodotorula kratochvilovae]
MPKPQPGNPDWARWVDELAQRSEERGEKSSQTYKRAAASLHSCPIPFSHPDEALQLKGVGPKIVQYLVGKIRDQCEKDGLPMPDRVPSPSRPRKAPTTKKKRPSLDVPSSDEFDPREARRQRTTKTDLDAPRVQFQAHPDGHAWNEPPSEDGPAPRGGKGKGKAKEKEKEKAPPKPREYLPRQNSGAYAILLALYQCASADEPESWTTKSRIMEVGQDYSSTPFDQGTANRGGQAQAGQSFTYTAWAGMKTLQTKELVITDNKRPAKYALTAAGYALGEKLAPSAGIALHARVPTSSSAAHPSSSGACPLPGSSAFPGRGNALGGSTSGPRPAAHVGSSIHAAPARRRASSPLFAFSDYDDGAPSGDEGEDPAEDADFRAQMRRALELSRRESAGLSSDPAAAAAGGAGEERERRGLDGRRAASGVYAAQAREKRDAPGLKNVDNAFGYFYLNEADERVLSRADAEVSQTDEGADLLYRIEYRLAQDLHPIVRGLKRPEALSRPVALPGGPTRSAYIRARVSNELAPGFPKSTTAAAAPPVRERPADPVASLLGGYEPPAKKAKDAMYAPPPDVRRLGADPAAQQGQTQQPRGAGNVMDVLARFNAKGGAAGAATSSASSAAASTSSSFRPAGTSRPTAEPVPDTPSPRKRARPTASAILAGAAAARSASSTAAPLQAAFDAPPGAPLVQRHPLDPVRDHAPPAGYAFAPFAPVVWPRGSFKVVLIVDSREGTREQGKRVELCEKIAREGVSVDGKMLPLGDMLWVARRVDPQTGRPAGGDDVVLDAIVERKRLDDLCTSILDGRYVGQKFRLKDSGISHRIYLIEKYDVATQYEKFGKQIWTCKSQLQVNDGFYVHESANLADTISYLKKRTQVMAELYEGNDLHVIPDALIDRTTYLYLQQSLRARPSTPAHHTTYASFCALNRPDAALTLRAQWGSMLQRVSGVSAEKAVQFLGRWDTPIAFFEEAQAHEREVTRENALLPPEEAAPAGPGRKRAGAAAGAKKRKAEDYVVEELDDGSASARGIKGKLGARIWELFMTSGRYTS